MQLIWWLTHKGKYTNNNKNIIEYTIHGDWVVLRRRNPTERYLPSAFTMSGHLDCIIITKRSRLFTDMECSVKFCIYCKNKVLSSLWKGQYKSICSSLSIQFSWQKLHILFSGGVKGIVCLPVSICRLWELVRKREIAVR